MALTYVGSLSIGALCPIVLNSLGQAAIALSAALQGNLALNASLSVAPPTLSVQLALTAEFVAQLTAALTAVPPVPTVSFDLSACASLTVLLEAALALLLVLEGLLDAAIGIYSYGYSGPGNGIGPSLTTALATSWPDGQPTNTSTTVLLFGAATSLSQQQMSLFLDGITYGPSLHYSGRVGLDLISVVTARAATQGRDGLNAQLSASAALTAQASIGLPIPNLAAMLNYQANLIAIPDVSFALAATASAAASIQAKFGLLCNLGLALARFDATLFVYSYTGLGNALGPALSTALASTWGDGTTPTSGACTATILGATDTATSIAMGAFFGGA